MNYTVRARLKALLLNIAENVKIRILVKSVNIKILTLQNLDLKFNFLMILPKLFTKYHHA